MPRLSLSLVSVCFIRPAAWVLLLGLTTLLSSCGTGNTGDLIGAKDRGPWLETTPYGMVYIKQGTFRYGQGDQDLLFNLNNPLKNVTMRPFYMDDAEISNAEYRQFVNWVRDSIAHTVLGNTIEDEDGNEYINWKARINWKDPAVVEELEDLFLPENQRVFGRQEWNTSRFVYNYKKYDYTGAVASQSNRNRNEFVESKSINIYPDTLVWTKDMAYAYNEPQTQLYFSHPAYYDYPVVGVTWNQANAFCDWRTRLLSAFRQSRKLTLQFPFRLPSEVEWEYAARGGRMAAPYPWGGPSLRNNRGCLLANFKPGRGNYVDDGVTYTAKTYTFNPNDFGLFNMAGNVAEWTASTFHESASSFVGDLNPDYRYDAKDSDAPIMKRKVVRGGSWKDVGYYLMNGTRAYEFQDSARSTIGFRCVMDFTGRDIRDIR
ncbi:MAG: SUMF1/EgtB/PvdO family nonheme iron enzyme [Bacteroidia bacterium]